MDWISVNDRLPEENNQILICEKDYNGKQHISLQISRKELFEGAFCPIDIMKLSTLEYFRRFPMNNKPAKETNPITHWTKIPELPSENDEECILTIEELEEIARSENTHIWVKYLYENTLFSCIACDAENYGGICAVFGLDDSYFFERTYGEEWIAYKNRPMN